jgi:homopolymeric O-antigen transport system ATP-binding protein
MSARLEVRDLSKVYILRHGRPAYSSLRDELAAFARHPRWRARGTGEFKEELWALSDVTFDVEQGDVVGVVGRNGSGKSTLLKILSRIVEPTRGHAVIRGRVTSLLEVGTGFHPELTGRENVQLNGALLGMPRKEIRRRFDEIVEFAGVERFLDTPVKFYSSGMYVRLAFAVAAHLDPDILVVDEVLAVGDAGFQRKSLGKMSSAAETGKTILFVSHHADSVRSLCNRGIHLSSGRIAAIGKADDALRSYQEELEAGVGDVDAARRKPHGAGGVLIAGLGSFDSKGRATPAFDPDEEIVFHLRLRIDPELVGRPLNVGIGVDTEAGHSAFTTFSAWSDTLVVGRAETLVVRCRIPTPHLVGGRYFVSASVLSEGATLDHVTRHASFEVRTSPDEILWPQRVLSHGPLKVDCVFEDVPTSSTLDVSEASA